MYFKEIENYKKHDKNITFVMESEENEEIYATWDETRKCYGCFIRWIEINDVENWEHEEEHHGSFWKTDKELKNCKVHDIIELEEEKNEF